MKKRRRILDHPYAGVARACVRAQASPADGWSEFILLILFELFTFENERRLPDTKKVIFWLFGNICTVLFSFFFSFWSRRRQLRAELSGIILRAILFELFMFEHESRLPDTKKSSFGYLATSVQYFFIFFSLVTCKIKRSFIWFKRIWNRTRNKEIMTDFSWKYMVLDNFLKIRKLMFCTSFSM